MLQTIAAAPQAVDWISFNVSGLIKNFWDYTISGLTVGAIYALVAMALFLSYRVLNIADMTTDGAFTLGCAYWDRCSA